MNSINLNCAKIAAIEEMAANGFAIEEIVEVVFNDDELTEDGNKANQAVALLDFNEKGIVFTTYRKGLLQSQLELRQRIFKDAKNGSSPAQALAKKILDDAVYKIDNG